MKKKILIGSIIAVTVLILVSFSSVIGYPTTKASFDTISPLFSTRTHQVIDEQENAALQTKYIGKGEAVSIALPKRYDTYTIAQQAFDEIRTMDEQTLERCVGIAFSKVHLTHLGEKIGVDDIVTLLKESDDGSIDISNYIGRFCKGKTVNNTAFSGITNDKWFPGKLLLIFFDLMLNLILNVILTLINIIMGGPGFTFVC